MHSTKYLEALKEKHGLKNDRQLAIHLNVTSGTISQYMSGKRIMDDEACLRVAMDLDIDPLKVIAAAGLDRAAKTGQASLWEVFLKKTAATSAAAVLVGVCLFSTQGDAQAAPLRPEAAQRICIMLNRMHAWLTGRLGPSQRFFIPAENPGLHALDFNLR